jgi:hypothetical protein
MNLIAWAVVVALLNLLIAEALDWMPWLAAKVINQAARMLPPEARARYRDEWLGELEALPGRRFSCVVFAVRVLVRAPATRAALAPDRAARTPSGLPELVSRALAGSILFWIAPVYLTIVGLVALTGGRPILARTVRYAPSGAAFTAFSFSLHRRRTGEYTSLSALLTRWDLDQLPTLLNVLRGDMRLIGPPAVDKPPRRDSIVPADDRKPGVFRSWEDIRMGAGPRLRSAIAFPGRGSKATREARLFTCLFTALGLAWIAALLFYALVPSTPLLP